jgi:hypothetical protein
MNWPRNRLNDRHQKRVGLPLSGSTHIGIVEGDGEQVVPIATLRRRFAVHALIRLHSADFGLLSAQSRSRDHTERGRSSLCGGTNH